MGNALVVGDCVVEPSPIVQGGIMSVNELIRLLSTLPEGYMDSPVLLEVKKNIRHNMTTMAIEENCIVLCDLGSIFPRDEFEEALRKAVD
jgi:hypothetical protein